MEKQATEAIVLEDEDAEIDPAPASGGGFVPEPEMSPLSVILDRFNSRWGTEFSDPDLLKNMTSWIPDKVGDDELYRNAQRHTDEENARIEHDRALLEVVIGTLNGGAEFYKLFTENEDFRRDLSNLSFSATYRRR